MKPRLKEDPREWRKFALGSSVGLAALGLVLWAKQVLPDAGLRTWLLGLASVLLASLARPGWFRGPYRAGLTWSHYVGQGLGRLILFLLFWLLVTPLGLALRLAGKDLLSLRRDPKAASYWQPVGSPPRLDRMF